jgi:tetratricopeptide (TPR) repeat protein
VIYYLGRIDLQEGSYERAIRELLKILPSPPFSDTTYYLGSAYLDEGNLVQSERWLREAAKANLRDFRVADHLARVYQKEKQTAKAEREYALSLRLRQYYNNAASQAVACDHALQAEPLDRARAVCQQIAESHDEDKLILLGMLYGRHGDYRDALPPLEAAVRIDPNSWAAEHNLGLTFFRLRLYSEALAPLRQAVELRPEYFGSSALLGATLYALKKDHDAFRMLRHAHQLNPQNSASFQRSSRPCPRAMHE